MHLEIGDWQKLRPFAPLQDLATFCQPSDHRLLDSPFAFAPLQDFKIWVKRRRTWRSLINLDLKRLTTGAPIDCPFADQEVFSETIVLGKEFKTNCRSDQGRRRRTDTRFLSISSKGRKMFTNQANATKLPQFMARQSEPWIFEFWGDPTGVSVTTFSSRARW
jgi:hypothetical protein